MTRFFLQNRFLFALFVGWICVHPITRADDDKTGETSAAVAETPATGDGSTEEESNEPEELPWDYSPYKVLIWIASEDPRYNADSLREPVSEYLNRDFNSIWRTTVVDAPPAVATLASRSMKTLTHEQLVASDPVIAVKMNHEDAVRIQSIRTLKPHVSNVGLTSGMLEVINRRAEAFGDSSMFNTSDLLTPFDGDALALAETWADDSTEALVVTRGQALALDEPKAKFIAMPISGLVFDTLDEYDKVYIVRIREELGVGRVAAIELETLMRHFGSVIEEPFASNADLPQVVGHCVTRAFSPMVRIDEAGQKTAVGLIRAGRLILDPESPANVHVGDALQPMIRKNDRIGNPIKPPGRVDWACLITMEKTGPEIKMDYHSGRYGGLQGRQNRRTFRMGMKVNPRDESTELRLHVQGRKDLPLIGYELYERDLSSSTGKAMTFVVRTNWDGRLNVEKGDRPMRLLYVKNGGAVLARLPLIPGLTEQEVADLKGDDLRLQAEAYIRGVRNAIVDLVAVRKLLAARIRKRLRKGQTKEAEDLYKKLREQPTNEKLANEMGRRQAGFLQEIGIRNVAERKKIDSMFSKTREMLGKQINDAIIRELGADFDRAAANGGKLPPDPPKEEEGAFFLFR
ncbi:MAG: hypothetical protein AAFX06_03175, partial [Planctomycetota bacterium]